MSYDPLPGGANADQYPGPPLVDGVATATSTRNTITATASATPHTMGAWVEIDPSLSADCAGIYVAFTNAVAANGVNSSTLVDIGIGGSGSETVWATAAAGYRAGGGLMIPGFIAAGTRTAVRCQSAVASQTVSMVVTFLPSTKSSALGVPVTYQADASASKGLTITAPGSLNTKGAFTQLVASTAVDLAALTVTAQGAGATTMAATSVLIDIGIGAAAFETVLIGDLHLLGSSTSESYAALTPVTYGLAIPAGSRLSARYARASSGNALDIVLIGTKAA